MTYRATENSSALTPEERVAEAKRILFDLKLVDYMDMMTPKEQSFVGDQKDKLEPLSREPQWISIKQLWWLRDLKEKYID